MSIHDNVPLRCGCGTVLHDDDVIWFWTYGEDERDVLVETTVGHSDADDFLADGEEGFCSRDCGYESRCAEQEARWFEDAAYGTD